MKFMRRKKKRTNPLGQRRRRMFRLKMVLLFIVVVVIIGIFAWILRLPEVVITDISVSGNSLTKTEEIVEIANKNLAGSYLFVVPKNSEFFLPKNKIAREIEETFTRIESASAELTGGKRLQINVVERKPFALWCGNVYRNTEEELGHCFFIDEESYVFAKAPDFTGNIFFKYFGELNSKGVGTSTNLGGVYMEQAEFDAINVFLNAFREIEYIPVSFARVDDKDFSIRTTLGTEILFGNDTQLSVVLDNMESVIDSEVFTDIKQEDIEYIDLRFGSRVYYKLYGEEVVEQ